MAAISSPSIRDAGCAVIPHPISAADVISPTPGISAFQLIYRAKREKRAAAASREANRNRYLLLEQEAFSDVLDEDEVYRSLGIRNTTDSKDVPVSITSFELEKKSSIRSPSNSSILGEASKVENDDRRSSRESGHEEALESACEKPSLLRVVQEMEEKKVVKIGPSKRAVLDTGGSSKSSLGVNSMENRLSEHPSNRLLPESSFKFSTSFSSVASLPKESLREKRALGILDVDGSVAQSKLETQMRCSELQSKSSPAKLREEVERSRSICPPLMSEVVKVREDELALSSFVGSPKSTIEALYSSPVKNLKLIYPLKLDVSPGLQRSLENLEDEVFPGAHKIMRSIIYDAYGLIPSAEYRLTSGDFFDSATVVGLTSNMVHHDVDSYPYKTDMSYPLFPDNTYRLTNELWRNEEFLKYIDTWWHLQSKKNARSGSQRSEVRPPMPAGFQLSISKYPKLAKPGPVDHETEADEEHDKNKNKLLPVAYDWVDLTQCCLVLVNGLGNAFRAMYETEQKNTAGDSARIPSITEEHIRLWSLQYIQLGLHRLLTDQMGAHTMVFRSAFSLLCSVPAQRLPYSVFTTIFLSKITGRLSLASIEQHTNIDYRCTCIKKRGLPYLPFAFFLREICAKETSCSVNRRERSVSPSSVGAVSLLKVWQAIEVIMQPAIAARLFHGMENSKLLFPVHFVRSGLEALARLRSSWQMLYKFITTEPHRGPKFKENDKTSEDLLKTVVKLSSVSAATHVATKCLLILVLFVNWMDADCKGKEDGDMDVRSWTQRVFAEANAYYRVTQNLNTEEDQKAVCADVVALFYAFFDTSNPLSQIVKYLEKKEMVGLEVIGILRQQINDALEIPTNDAGSRVSSPIAENPGRIGSPTASSSKSTALLGDNENFNNQPNGPLLLDGLIRQLISSVGTVFFSYDIYMDGIVTYFSTEHVQAGSTTANLDVNNYKVKLRHARNPFKEMEAVTFCVKTFNSMLEKSMGYLQAFWGATRWLRLEIDLCTGRDASSSSVSGSIVPKSFAQCVLLLGDCIIAGWPHQRKQRIPFRRVPQKGTKKRNSFQKTHRPTSGLKERSGNFSLTGLREMKVGCQFSNDPSSVGEGMSAKPFSPNGTLYYSCNTERSIDDVFGDLVISNQSDTSFVW